MSSATSPFDTSAAERVSADRYGIEVRARTLPGYGDLNFRLDDAAGPVGTLKLALESPERAHLEAQNAALDHLATQGLPVPRVRAGLDHHQLQDIRLADGRTVMVRLLTWVPGRPLGGEEPASLDLERQTGVLLGRVALGLRDFQEPPIRRAWAWDLAQAHLARAALAAIEDAPLHDLLAARLDHFDRELRPALRASPRAWIHGDGNAWNVLVSDDGPTAQVAGLIDFGDLAHTARVCDVAIATGYALLRHNGGAGARALLAGYESVLPLHPEERALLPTLAPLRLAVSAAMSAAARRQCPDNDYLSADAGPAAAWLLAQGHAPLDGLID